MMDEQEIKTIYKCLDLDLCLYGQDCGAWGCAWTYPSEKEQNSRRSVSYTDGQIAFLESLDVVPLPEPAISIDE